MQQTQENRYYTLQEQMENSFCRLPKALIYEEKYKNLKNDSKILYSYLLDKTDVSYFNKWVDEEGRLFIHCTIGTICNLLNVGESKATACKKELIKADLLEILKKGQDKDTFYIKKPIVTVEHTKDYYGIFIEESRSIDAKLRGRVIKHREKNNVPHCPNTGKLLPQMKRENHVSNENDINNEYPQGYQHTYQQDYPQDERVKYGELVENTSLEGCGQKCNVKSTENETWNLRCSDTEFRDTKISSVCNVDEQQSQLTKNENEEKQIAYMYELEDVSEPIVTFMKQFGTMSEYQINTFNKYQGKIENQVVEDIVINALNKTPKVVNLINYTLKVLRENEKKNITTAYEYQESLVAYKNKCAGYAKAKQEEVKPNAEFENLNTDIFVPDNFVPQETQETNGPVETLEDKKKDEQKEIETLAFKEKVDLSKHPAISLSELKNLIDNKNNLIVNKMSTYADFMTISEKLQSAKEDLGFLD